MDLLKLTFGGLVFVGMLQIDSDSIDYVEKLEIHYVAPCTCIMCLVDTLIPCMRHSPMFSAEHELERNV